MSAVAVAVAQADAVPCDVEANTRTALRLLDAAKEKKADIVVFPELFLCGYDLDAIAAEPHRAAIPLDGDPIRALGERCARLGLAAIVGACLARPDGRTNSALVIDAQGRLADVYDKINLWTTERPLFAAGSRLVVVGLANLRVGLAICYDAGFPEHARALALTGAELVACPSAFVAGDEEHRYDLYFPMRALENTVYLAVANLAGGNGFFGRSAVFDPAGHRLSAAGAGEAVVVAEVDRRRLQAVRRELRYLEHLRPEIYGRGGTP